MSSSLVVFDLDGTLVDSRRDLTAAVNAVLRDLGAPLRPHAEIEGFIGHGMDRLLERSLGGTQLLEPARRLFEEYYGAGLLDRTRPYPGIDGVIERLAPRHALAVATNKPGRWAREIVAGLGWGLAIRHVVGGGDVPRLKPAADMLELLLARTGSPPERAVVVGDMQVDVLFARSASVRCVGVGWGLDGPAPLRAAGADRVVGSAAELVDALAALVP